LTKETNINVSKGAATLKRRLDNGEIIPSNTGKVMSDEQKKKISDSRIKYLIKHPEQVLYRLNHSSKMSYPEIIMMNTLVAHNISGWVYISIVFIHTILHSSI